MESSKFCREGVGFIENTAVAVLQSGLISGRRADKIALMSIAPITALTMD
jgi:hypothetical protein